MSKVTPCHIAYYNYPSNQYLKWKDWNCLYDFVYANQDKVYNRTHLFTQLSTLQLQVRIKIHELEEIKWHVSKTLAHTKSIKLI